MRCVEYLRFIPAASRRATVLAPFPQAGPCGLYHERPREVILSERATPGLREGFLEEEYNMLCSIELAGSRYFCRGKGQAASRCAPMWTCSAA